MQRWDAPERRFRSARPHPQSLSSTGATTRRKSVPHPLTSSDPGNSVTPPLYCGMHGDRSGHRAGAAPRSGRRRRHRRCHGHRGGVGHRPPVDRLDRSSPGQPRRPPVGPCVVPRGGDRIGVEVVDRPGVEDLRASGHAGSHSPFGGAARRRSDHCLARRCAHPLFEATRSPTANGPVRSSRSTRRRCGGSQRGGVPATGRAGNQASAGGRWHRPARASAPQHAPSVMGRRRGYVVLVGSLRPGHRRQGVVAARRCGRRALCRVDTTWMPERPDRAPAVPERSRTRTSGRRRSARTVRHDPSSSR